MPIIYTMFKCSTQDWAFTVRILLNPKSATTETYDPFFDHIKHFVHIFKIVPETKNGVLHYHGMYTACSNLYRKKLCLYGYHCKFRRIYDQAGWDNYIHKSVEPQGPLLRKCLFKTRDK